MPILNSSNVVFSSIKAYPESYLASGQRLKLVSDGWMFQRQAPVWPGSSQSHRKTKRNRSLGTYLHHNGTPLRFSAGDCLEKECLVSKSCIQPTLDPTVVFLMLMLRRYQADERCSEKRDMKSR